MKPLFDRRELILELVATDGKPLVTSEDPLAFYDYN